MSNLRTTTRALTAFAGTVALSIALAACGSDDDDGGSASEVQTASNGDVFNSADVDFATGMIPHHAQAIEMTVLAQGRPLDGPVQQLVEQIREAQAPEVELMTDWLTAWDQEVPATSLDHVNADHGDHGAGDGAGDEDADDGDLGHDMPGMMTADQMAELAAAPDAEFQDLWLEMMIEHHEGAIEMAEVEQDEGEFADAIALAESIASSQEAEIATMEELLG